MSASSSKVQIIRIRDCIDKNLSLRIYADDFFKHIELLEENDLVIDFDGVIFVSRSFAQEFSNLMKTSHKHITITNQSEEIKAIFKAVQSPRRKANIF
jgi:anti-anti-sigma regulatory factor